MFLSSPCKDVPQPGQLVGIEISFLFIRQSRASAASDDDDEERTVKNLASRASAREEEEEEEEAFLKIERLRASGSARRTVLGLFSFVDFQSIKRDDDDADVVHERAIDFARCDCMIALRMYFKEIDLIRFDSI
jgi:hypothetical protein